MIPKKITSQRHHQATLDGTTIAWKVNYVTDESSSDDNSQDSSSDEDYEPSDDDFNDKDTSGLGEKDGTSCF